MEENIFEGLEPLQPEAQDGTDSDGYGGEPENLPEQDGTEDASGEGMPEPDSGDSDGADAAHPHEGQQPEQEIEIVYNGERRKIPVSEAARLAQKGMNYDKAVERARRQGAEQSEAGKLIRAYAEKNGMTEEEYIRYAQGEMSRKELEALTKTMPEQQAQELLRYRAEAKKREAEQRERQEQEEREKPFREFAEKYPDVKEFPPEVLEGIRKGQSPISAYQDYEIQRLKAQLAAGMAAEQNRSSTPGSVSGAGGQKDDPFLAGLEGRRWGR